jgi:hypothetical protein
MRRGTIGALVGTITVIGGAIAPSAAPADGLPAGSASPRTGIESLDGAERYVALDGGRGTTIAQISQKTGEVLKSGYLRNDLAVPGVAFDGSATGLSADGQTLVLSQTFAPDQSETKLAVLDARRLSLRDRVELRGSFTLDAISPDGRWLYLIEYLSPRNLSKYNVRAYDLERGRLLPDPITDPDESGDEMYGTPMTRAMSPDGRWAYTLYDGEETFIHALDTRKGAAVCIDLDDLQAKPWRLDMRSSPNGRALELTQHGESQASVDTRTFEVTYSSGAGAASQSDGNGDGEHGWLLAIPAAGAAALACALVLRRRRAAPAG